MVFERGVEEDEDEDEEDDVVLFVEVCPCGSCLQGVFIALDMVHGYGFLESVPGTSGRLSHGWAFMSCSLALSCHPVHVLNEGCTSYKHWTLALRCEGMPPTSIGKIIWLMTEAVSIIRQIPRAVLRHGSFAISAMEMTLEFPKLAFLGDLLVLK